MTAHRVRTRAMTRNTPTIDGDRFWSTIMASAEIGAGPRGGLARLTLSEADGRMRALFRSWAEEAGYGVTVDRLGHMVVRRAGTEDGLPPVLVGRHLDTQAAGGRFDGLLGVMEGLERFRAIDDRSEET